MGTRIMSRYPLNAHRETVDHIVLRGYALDSCSLMISQQAGHDSLKENTAVSCRSEPASLFARGYDDDQN